MKAAASFVGHVGEHALVYLAHLGVADKRITWTLEDLGGCMRLLLVHDGFTRPVDVSDYPFGWQHFMGEIGKVAQTQVE